VLEQAAVGADEGEVELTKGLGIGVPFALYCPFNLMSLDPSLVKREFCMVSNRRPILFASL
jgi:hypothetical protein